MLTSVVTFEDPAFNLDLLMNSKVVEDTYFILDLLKPPKDLINNNDGNIILIHKDKYYNIKSINKCVDMGDGTSYFSINLHLDEPCIDIAEGDNFTVIYKWLDIYDGKYVKRGELNE